MTTTAAIALFVSMIVLAVIPGPGVLTVMARSASCGVRHGFAASAGVVAGDYLFITFALMGLMTLSSVMGDFFVLIKYLGAAYLIWLGISLATSTPQGISSTKVNTPSYIASFAAGLITTISNPKAIFFYLSFFPAFLDLSLVTSADAIMLYAIATAAIGGVMAAYAYLANKAKGLYANSSTSKLFRRCSGSMLIGSGIYIAARN